MARYVAWLICGGIIGSLNLFCSLSKFLQSYFGNVEEVVAFAYISINGIFFLATSFLYPYWDRFGYRWQCVCVSALLVVGLAFARMNTFSRFLAWFRRSRLVQISVAISLVWLFLMGIVHGFLGFQKDGLLSGLLFALMFPVSIYVWERVPRVSLCRRAVFVVLLAAVLLEDIFLTLYALVGESMNASFLISSANLPRVFLNIRDGNSMAVCLSILAFAGLINFWFLQDNFNERDSLLPSRWSWVISIVALVVVFYNASLTQGRGLVVSIFLGLLSVSIVRFMEMKKLLRLWLSFVVSGILGYGLWRFVFSLFKADQAALVQLIERGSSGRFDLWQAWLRSMWSTNPIVGHGLGWVPKDFLPQENMNLNPHNIAVQLLGDGGFLGLLFGASLIILIVIAIFRARYRLDDSLKLLFGLVSFGSYNLVAGVLDWPAGVLLLALSPMLLPPLCRNNCFPGSEASQMKIGQQQFIFVVYFLVLSAGVVVLTTSKQLIFMPNFMIPSSPDIFS